MEPLRGGKPFELATELLEVCIRCGGGRPPLEDTDLELSLLRLSDAPKCGNRLSSSQKTSVDKSLNLEACNDDNFCRAWLRFS